MHSDWLVRAARNLRWEALWLGESRAMINLFRGAGAHSTFSVFLWSYLCWQVRICRCRSRREEPSAGAAERGACDKLSVRAEPRIPAISSPQTPHRHAQSLSSGKPPHPLPRGRVKLDLTCVHKSENTVEPRAMSNSVISNSPLSRTESDLPWICPCFSVIVRTSNFSVPRMPTVVLRLIFELRTGCSCQWRRFAWHCAAENFENLSLYGRIRFRFVRMRFEQKNSVWIETESARSAAEVSFLVVPYRRVRRGGGKGGRRGEDCQIWRNEQRSLVRQEITQVWARTSFIQTYRSTTLVWAPCGLQIIPKSALCFEYTVHCIVGVFSAVVHVDAKTAEISLSLTLLPLVSVSRHWHVNSVNVEKKKPAVFLVHNLSYATANALN